MTGDDNYRRTGRHYCDFIDGWKFIDDIYVCEGYLWLGDPEDPPTREEVPISGMRSFGSRGVAVAFSPTFYRTEFRAEGLYRSHRLAAIRIVFDD